MIVALPELVLLPFFYVNLEDNLMYDYHSLGLWVGVTQHFTSK